MHIMVDRVTSVRRKRREHSEDLKRELVERSLQPGASVSAIALEAGINANLLFAWRRQRGAFAKATPTPLLLPVEVQPCEPQPSAPAAAPARTANGTIDIELAGARIRVRGLVDEDDLRSVLKALRSLS